MRLTLLSIVLLVGTLAQCQGFNKRYDAFGWEVEQDGYGIELTANGYTVLSSSADCDSISPEECLFHGSVLLTRIGPDGEQLWEKRAWRPNHSAFAGWANCCDTIPGGGYITGGASEAADGSDEVYLMRFDANGDTLWTRVFGDPNNFFIGMQVKRTVDGGFIIIGLTGGNFGGNFDGFAIRTDSNGYELWRRSYGWIATNEYGLISVDLGANADLFMGGSQFFPDGSGDHWVQRTDEQGDLRWRVSWGGAFSDGAASITTLRDGHIVVCSGYGYANAYVAIRPYIAKIDSADGSLMWEQQYGPIAYSTGFFAGKETPNGDLIACGVTYANSGMNNVQQGLLLRTNSEGDSLWMRSYFFQDDVISNGQGRFYDVLPTPDGGFIAAGSAYNPVGAGFPPGYSQDTWVVKVDGDGCIVPGCNTVGVTEQATNLLGALSIYPNPAQGRTTISLTLPPSVANEQLQLCLVAADGRIVQHQTITGNGQHALALEQLSAGVYHLHISATGKWLTGGKLVLE